MNEWTDVTLHWIKGLSRTKIGNWVRTMKSQKAKPPTFLRAISFTCRLSRYHWFPNERSKQTSTTFRAAREKRMRCRRKKRGYKIDHLVICTQTSTGDVKVL